MSQEDFIESQAGEGEGEATPRPDELSMLKQRAKLLGINFSNNIGLEALRAKVNGKLKSEDNEPEEEFEMVEETAQAVSSDSLSEAERAELNALREAVARQSAQAEAATLNKAIGLNPLAGDKAGAQPAAQMTKRQRIIREAMKLVRCQIVNLDPKKKELHGEILCVGNKYIGTVKKFIPFGEQTDNGYHIPKVLYDELESRKFLHITTRRNKANGQIDVKTSYAKEFSITVLPPLTPAELAQLAANQMAASNAG